MTGRAPSWTAADRERVAELLQEGKSMGRISRLMGLTRNMVIGRINRDGELHAFVGRAVVKKRIEGDERRIRISRASVPIVPALKPQKHVEPFACEEAATLPGWPWKRPFPDERSKPLLELQRNDCRWPIADVDSVVGGQLFCAEPRAGEWTPYCDKHHRKAHG